MLTVRLQPDPTGWTTAKHFTFAAVIVLELAALAILLLRPNLLIARALAAAVILPNIGSISNLAHWTGNEAVAIVTAVSQRFFVIAGIAALWFRRARIVDVDRFESGELSPTLRSPSVRWSPS